jgi:cysteine desulfurase/selenocysteine lyase
VRDLASRLRSQLRELPGVRVHDLGQTQCGIVSFAVAGQSASTVRDRLRARQINVSITRLTSTRLDMTARGLDELVRASIHYYNTNDELDQLCDAVSAL